MQNHNNDRDINYKINSSSQKEGNSNKQILGMQGQQKITVVDNFNIQLSKTCKDKEAFKSNQENYVLNLSGMRPAENNLKINSQQELEGCSFADSQIDQIEIMENDKQLNRSAYNAYDSSFKKFNDKNRNFTNQYSI